MKGQDPYIPSDSLRVNIKSARFTLLVAPRKLTSDCLRLVAVFDTVGSVFGMEDALGIKDNHLPTIIDNAYHILAIHENREKFLSTLWAEPPNGLRKGQVLKQVQRPH